MRVNELNAQIEAVEQALRRLQNDALSAVWVVFPISHAPCPDKGLIQRWLTELGLPDDVEIQFRPGRYQSAIPLLSVTGFVGDFPAGWELVEVTIISSPLLSKKADTAWVNPTFTQKYRQWLKNRDKTYMTDLQSVK